LRQKNSTNFSENDKRGTIVTEQVLLKISNTQTWMDGHDDNNTPTCEHNTDPSSSKRGGPLQRSKAKGTIDLISSLPQATL
jgi:hypothetical protein